MSGLGELHLLSAVELSLLSLEALLAGLHGLLVGAVQRALGGTEVLLRYLQRLLSLDALVRDGGLLSAVELGLGGLEVLRGQVLLGGERLGANALGSLELALNLVLSGRELLASRLQRELVLLSRIELSRLVLRGLVGQGAVGVGLGVLQCDGGRAIDHRGHASALGHGAVDQAALVHVLHGQRAGALHQRAVLRKQGFDLAGSRLGGLVDLSQRRGVVGCLREVGAARAHVASLGGRAATGIDVVHRAADKTRAARVGLLGVEGVFNGCWHAGLSNENGPPMASQ